METIVIKKQKKKSYLKSKTDYKDKKYVTLECFSQYSVLQLFLNYNCAVVLALKT